MHTVDFLSGVLLFFTAALCFSNILVLNTLQKFSFFIKKENLTKEKNYATIYSDKEITDSKEKDSKLKISGKKIRIIHRTPEQKRDVIRAKKVKKMSRGENGL